MWATISRILINIVIAIISDKVVIAAGKKLIVKGVDSAVKGVGIDNGDVKDLLHEITRSALNTYDSKPINW